MLNDSKDCVFGCLQHHHTRGFANRGIALKCYMFQDFLKSHVVVKSDKDGLAVLMPKQVYLSEARAQMNSKSGYLNIYQCLGKNDTTKKSLE